MLRIVLTLFIAGMTHTAHADTVWLRNGDRLTSKIVYLNGSTLVLDTPYAGRVSVDWAQVATLATDDPLVVWDKETRMAKPVTLHAADPGWVMAGDTAASPKIALEAVTRLVYPRTHLIDWRFEGAADVSVYAAREAERTNEYRVNVSTRAESDQWRHITSGNFEYGTTNGDHTADRWGLDYSLDRFMGERAFARLTMTAEEDQFSTISAKRQVGVGGGYRFVDDAIVRFDLTGSFRRAEYRLAMERYLISAWLLSWDYRRFLFGERFELYTVGDITLPRIQAVDYAFDGEAGMRLHVNEWLRVSAGLEFSALKADFGRQHERRLSISAGATW